MKNKVVIFTQNNARILVNPPDLSKFDKKENAFVNPDLSLVTGIEPQFWKLIKPDQPIDLNSAHRLRKELDDLLVILEAQNKDSEASIFYRTLREELQNQIQASEKAFDLLSKLIPKANGIDREDVTTALYDRLMSHSTNAAQQKQNLIFKHMIHQWEMGTIIPMDDEERKARSTDINLRGISNKPYNAVKKRLMHKHALFYSLLLIIIASIAYKLAIK